ncbi:isoaspartyl peptidase/L-asparaginase [Parashewanella curva]|uniref:Isoaspartyl peptidase n=1 Tax=Parashewanella curva TaxID=2338552 RepID=A0A3L8PUX5_9GAMM|nr:isoaspartyl peptidase/L-asparaginase [Parashewanella curva]
MTSKLKYLAATLVASALLSQPVLAQSSIAIAIHGGAGTISPQSMTSAQKLRYEAKLKQATDMGYNILAKGGSSIEAISAAVNVLEDSPLFNAGIGAVYTYDGAHELDASIMDGKTLNAGAVTGVKHIQNPINLARLVMTHSVHVMLSGEGAEEFALQQGMPLVANSTFDTERRYQSLLKAKQKLHDIKAKSKSGADYQANYVNWDNSYKMGTVGAVAVDKQGNIAAATSTGGMTAKRYGRIGDSPIIGAGTWADNDSCAVSATGHGEYFIRFNVASDICARVKYQGKDIQKASDEVIFGEMKQAGGTGGVIVVDAKGNVAMSFNTQGMYRAFRKQGQQAQVAIFK